MTTQDDAIREVRDSLGLSWDHAERAISQAEELLIARKQEFDWSDCCRLAIDSFTSKQLTS